MSKVLAIALTQVILPSTIFAQPFTGVKSQASSCQIHFQELGLNGSIIVRNLSSGATYEHNPQRNNQPFLPASTFKILNALIALETKVVPSSKTIFPWDGMVRSIPEWNQDLDMEQGFQFSAVWYYQILARRIGHSRMKTFVEAVGYGNKNIGAVQDLDRFWLEGELRISPLQQIDFLKRSYREELPFSKNVISTVKNMMVIERTNSHTIGVKTGWVGSGTDKPQIGWYVGYLEKGTHAYLFATNIDINKNADGASRKEVTYRCLRTLGYL